MTEGQSNDKPNSRKTQQRVRSYLTDGGVIPISPDVAVLYGINEAAFLQQLHFLLSSAEVSDKKYNFVDGHWWVYYSYPRWKSHLPWLSIMSIRRLIEGLIEKEVITIRANPHNSWDKTRWYRLVYEVFYSQLEAAAAAEEEADAPAPAEPAPPASPSVQIEHIDDDKVNTSNGSDCTDDSITISNNDPLDELKDTSTEERSAGVPNDPPEVVVKNERPKPFPVYDAVEGIIFKQPYDQTIPRNWNAPVGGISRWLMGDIEKYGRYKVGKIKTVATPADVTRFTEWWAISKQGAFLPQDFNKFVQHWREWQSTLHPAPAADQKTPAAPAPAPSGRSVKDVITEKMKQKKG